MHVIIQRHTNDTRRPTDRRKRPATHSDAGANRPTRTLERTALRTPGHTRGHGRHGGRPSRRALTGPQTQRPQEHPTEGRSVIFYPVWCISLSCVFQYSDVFRVYSAVFQLHGNTSVFCCILTGPLYSGGGFVFRSISLYSERILIGTEYRVFCVFWSGIPYSMHATGDEGTRQTTSGIRAEYIRIQW